MFCLSIVLCSFTNGIACSYERRSCDGGRSSNWSVVVLFCSDLDLFQGFWLYWLDRDSGWRFTFVNVRISVCASNSESFVERNVRAEWARGFFGCLSITNHIESMNQ